MLENDDIINDRPSGFITADKADDIYTLMSQWSELREMRDIDAMLLKMDAPSFWGKHLIYREGKKCKPAGVSFNEWATAMEKLRSITRSLQVKENTVRALLSRAREYSRSLQSCCPLPYDCQMFWLGWAYQNKFIRKVKHWSTARIPDSIEPEAKIAYEKCLSLFEFLIEGLKTHNFTICYWEDATEASFKFTVEGVPGDIEIYFPLIVSIFGNTKASIEYNDKPMSMNIGWHFHDVIPVIDRFLGNTYSLDDIKKSLKSYVENSEWRNDLHKKFAIKDDDGNEIEIETPPDWYEARIQESIAQSAMEKDWGQQGNAA